MEDAEAIRITATKMKLATLEAEYCNTNWEFNTKIKELKEMLALKSRKQNDLEEQVANLKSSFAQHKADLGWAVSEMVKLESSPSLSKQSHNCTSNSSNSMRYSPKNEGRRLFFRLGKEGNKHTTLSPNLTAISSTSLRTRLIYDESRVNPEKKQVIAPTRYRNTEANMQNEPNLNQLR